MLGKDGGELEGRGRQFRIRSGLILGACLFIGVLALGLGKVEAGSRALADLPQGVSADEPDGLQSGFYVPSGRAHPKLDTPLTELAQVERAAPDGLAALASARGLRLEGGRVQVQLKVAPGAEAVVTGAVTAAGGEVTDRYRNSLQAWVSPGQILPLAKRVDVYRIQTPPTAIELEPWNGVLTISEGVVALNGDTWHSGGHTGAGVKIAIIDAGFGGYAALLGSELPAVVRVKNFVDGENDGDVGRGPSAHGTACAEIIHDVAPGAELYLLKIATDLDLANAVSYALAEDVDVISTSIGWSGITSNDGTGYFAELVATARAAGVLWVTAAGNFGETHWSGGFEDYGDGTHRFRPNQNWNAFSPEGSANCYSFAAGSPINVVLQWDDWAAVNQDYDLYLLFWDGGSWGVEAYSLNVQNGRFGQLPVERIQIRASRTGCYAVRILRVNATRDVHFDLFAYNMLGLNVREPARSLANLADSPGAITVGAVHHAAPYVLESFSSRGPTNGPGGRPTGGLIKPDVAAYDGVSTASLGARSFYGTSASTPHVAGAAALVRAARPDWHPDEVQGFLEEAALDQGSAGKDNEYGSGRLWLANLLSVELINWPTIVPARQPPTVTWEIQVGNVADTYVGWDRVPSAGSPPAYAYQTGVYHDVGGGVYSSAGEILDPTAERYYLRAFVQDASGSRWTEERTVNVDPHEPEDDVWQTAYSLSPGVQEARAYIRDEADVDWYTFEIVRPGTVYTVTLTPPPGVDLDLALYAPVFTPTLEELEVMAATVPIAELEGGGGLAEITDLAAMGAQPNAAADQVSHRAWFDTGPQWVKVSGYNGAYSGEQAYRVDVEVDTSEAWPSVPVTLPDYAPPADEGIKTLFVTHWERINHTHGVTASSEITTALNSILGDTEVMGKVIDLSNLDTAANTNLVNQAFTAWDNNMANPYLASHVGRIVQDVVADAVRHSYPSIQYIVIIGDDHIVPFMRLPDRTEVGNEAAYRDASGALMGSPAYAALDGGLYLTDDCYADLDPLAWPGGRLCVPDYAIGRLVERPAQIVASIQAFSNAGGELVGEDALVTGYGFLTDQAHAVSETLGSLVTVRSLIGDTWTGAELEQLWIDSAYGLQSVNARFSHFQALPADGSAGVVSAGQIAANVWPDPVLGFTVGGHAGWSAYDAEFIPARARDFSQAMAAEGAIWIGPTGYAVGDAVGIAYAEDLMLRFTQQLASGMAGDSGTVGAALTQAKQATVATAAPGSLDGYDRKALMETTLYGLPHWKVRRAGVLITEGTSESHPVGSGAARWISSAGAVSTRTITLGLEYQIKPGTRGQVAEVTVTSVEDSLSLLTVADVSTGQEINAGRPQLPGVSLDVVYAETRVPRGVVALSGKATTFSIDPIVSRVVTDDAQGLTEPQYGSQGWFPSRPINVNRLGSYLGDGGNEGRLVLYPAQFQGASEAGGTLRAFEELRLEIYYEDSGMVDDWQPPLIRRVETTPGADRVEVLVEVEDPDPGVGQPSGVTQASLFYTMDGATWSRIRGTGSGDLWQFSLDLPAGSSLDALRFAVQVVDGAGNVAYSDNKGRLYGSVDSRLYLPLVFKDHG
jgi:hypothetical protein